MEENPKTNQVMDIQPPKQPEVAPLQPQQVETPSQPTATEPTDVNETQDLDITDVQEAPVEEQERSNEQGSPAADTPILAAAAQQQHKNHVPVVAIVCALVVSGAIAALTVYSFTNADKPKDSTASQATVSPTPTLALDTAKSSDVDTLNSTIDQDLGSIDEAADYSDASVNDTSLGL